MRLTLTLTHYIQLESLRHSCYAPRPSASGLAQTGQAIMVRVPAGLYVDGLGILYPIYCLFETVPRAADTSPDARCQCPIIA